MKQIGYLTILFAFSLFTDALFAQSGKIGDSELTWNLSGGTLYIDGKGNFDENISAGGFWAEYSSEITKLVIGGEVNGLGLLSHRFYPNVLQEISVSSSNLYYHTGDNSIIDSSTGELVLGCMNSTMEGAHFIGGAAFQNCVGLIEMDLYDSSITEIVEGAFHGCTSLLSFSFPNGITTINLAVLGGCSSLTTLRIPKSVTSIDLEGEGAFYMCESLTSITCEVEEPINITTTQGGSFDIFCGVNKSQCTLYVPASSVDAYRAADGWKEFNIEPIGGMLATSLAFDITEVSLAPNETLPLTATILPEDVTNPTLSWTSSNKAVATVDANGVITAVSVGDAIITASTTDGSELSASCHVSVKISGTCGENLTWILDEATGVLTISGEGKMEDYHHLTEKQSPWKDYSSIKEVVIEEGVTSIGNCAFAATYGLSGGYIVSVSLPEGLETIGGAAFSGCHLSEINFPSSLINIGGEAFAYTSLREIFIPASVISIAGNSFYGTALTSIAVDEQNTVYDSREGCNGIIETATNKLILGCSNTTIPEGVEVIGAFAFTSGWDSEKVFSIPSSVKSIEGLAFWGTLSSEGEVACYATTSPALTDGGGFTELSEGKMRVLRVPTASINQYKDAGWEKYFCPIIGLNDVLATSITLDKTEAHVAFGGTLGLVATLLPMDVTNSELSWISSNENVATVDANGMVTAVAEGEATITVSTTDGSGLSASCIIHVEEEEINWDYANTLVIEDMEVRAGKQIELSVKLNNEVDITNFQFDLYLPEGITIAKDEDGYECINLSTERTTSRKHIFSNSEQQDGAMRVVCYSNSNAVFTGNEGEVLTITLDISDSMSEGDYTIQMKNIVLTEYTNSEPIKHTVPYVKSTITVYVYTLGDVNGDASIDVTDISGVVNCILSEGVEGNARRAADFNEDGAVDVTDISGVVNVILNGASSAVSEANARTRTIDSANGNRVYIKPFTLQPGEEKEIEVLLDNSGDAFTGVQLDLYLPEGISVPLDADGYYEVGLGSRTTNRKHVLPECQTQSTGALRILTYSNSNALFSGEEGDIMVVKVKGGENLVAGVYNLAVENVVLSRPDVTNSTPIDYMASIVCSNGGDNGLIILEGLYTSDVLDSFTSAFSSNTNITSISLTNALSIEGEGSLFTGNPNSLIYLAGGNTLANDNNVVCGDVCDNLLLTDGYAFGTISPFTAKNVNYQRNMTANKFGTIVLPFAPNTEDYEFYELTSVGDNTLTFDEVAVPVANTPYLYRLCEGKSATAIESNETPVSSELVVAEADGWQTVGSYVHQTISTNDEGFYAYTAADNQFHRVTKSLSVKPFRAYLKGNIGNVDAIKVRTRNGGVTLIDATEVNDDQLPEIYYDLSGRRVNNLTKGVYIVNGKKVVIK